MAARKNIDWSAQPLGRMVDSKIAGLLGVNVKSVARARRARGIAPAPRLKRPGPHIRPAVMTCQCGRRYSLTSAHSRLGDDMCLCCTEDTVLFWRRVNSSSPMPRRVAEARS